MGWIFRKKHVFHACASLAETLLSSEWHWGPARVITIAHLPPRSRALERAVLTPVVWSTGRAMCSYPQNNFADSGASSLIADVGFGWIDFFFLTPFPFPHACPSARWLQSMNLVFPLAGWWQPLCDCSVNTRWMLHGNFCSLWPGR